MVCGTIDDVHMCVICICKKQNMKNSLHLIFCSMSKIKIGFILLLLGLFCAVESQANNIPPKAIISESLEIISVSSLSSDHKTILKFKHPLHQRANVELFNTNGMRIHEQPLAKGMDNLKLDFAAYPEGVYVVVITCGDTQVEQYLFH